MPRYIDADDIEKDLVRYADSIDKTQTFSGVLRLIVRDTPTADVAPVKHGKWERTSKSLMSCSVCGNCVVDDRISGMFFCPNCGARMEESNDADT